MRDWSLATGDPLSLFLAADSRLSIPDYLNDHSWELHLGSGEPATLALLHGASHLLSVGFHVAGEINPSRNRACGASMVTRQGRIAAPLYQRVGAGRGK